MRRSPDSTMLTSQHHVTLLILNSFIIRLEARLQQNIGFTFEHALTVHAFRYNSTESEPIWVKSGALRHRQISAAIRAVVIAEEPGEVLFFSGKQCTILPTSRRPNFTKFEHNKSIGVAMNPFRTEF